MQTGNIVTAVGTNPTYIHLLLCTIHILENRHLLSNLEASPN